MFTFWVLSNVGSAAVSRLQAVSRRLCTELEREKDLELRLALTLKQNL